jgi:hypothetical protein
MSNTADGKLVSLIIYPSFNPFDADALVLVVALIDANRGSSPNPNYQKSQIQKKCANSNSSKNEQSPTDDGQDTHHKNGVPPIDPSSHHDNVLHPT